MDTPSELNADSAIPYDRKDAGEDSQRPNILLLMTDQQRFDTINAAGAEHMYTPQLDRLAASGRLYTRAFSPIPDGMAARHSLLTGTAGRIHGYTENNRNFGMPGWIQTFPRLLSDHGYETVAIGRNQFVPPRRHHGYDRVYLMENCPSFREEDDYAVFLKKKGWGHILNVHGCENLLLHTPQSPLLPEEYQGDSWAADKAIDFLETNRGRHPWLLKVSWLSPRPPQTPASRFAGLYKEAELPELLSSSTPLSTASEENAALFRHIPSQWFRRYRELYNASVSQVDYNIGRILDCLEDTEQRQNTLIIFFSDHGDMLGDYGCMEKGLPYDSCCRIPMILSFPGKIEAGDKNDSFVDLKDILPTVLDAAGISVNYKKSKLPGESLLIPPSEAKKDRSRQYIEYGSGLRRWVSLRTEKYKYNYYYREGKEEFFQLEDENGEGRNLLFSSLDEETAARKEEMKKELIAMEELWGPEGSISDDAFVRLEGTAAPQPRSGRFPVFQNSITDPREKQKMNGFLDEVLQCVEKEDMVELEQLDLENWQQEGGFGDKEIRELLDREKKLRNKQTGDKNGD